MEAQNSSSRACPACGGPSIASFYGTYGIPVHSVINIASREAALAFPRGDLELRFCHECGFIFNGRFDPANMTYCEQCEETQGFSRTFRSWHRKLAQSLADRYELRNKVVLEIGCGKGEFLIGLCELAGCSGVGFDPAYVKGRDHLGSSPRVQFVQDLYSEKYSSFEADLVCCKMTLEHIAEPLAFLRMLRNAIGDRPAVRVFFQVPDVRRVLREVAFWDIYYEHCSYFNLGSLARTFHRAGFEVLDLSTDYDGQYIMIHGKPSGDSKKESLQIGDVHALADDVNFFQGAAAERVAAWREELTDLHRRNHRVVLWGSGSKAVSFLSATGVADAIEYVVDINPYRQGTYLAGHGSRIVAPDFLSAYEPDTVLVMNEIYVDEIRRDLARLGLRPCLRTVAGNPIFAA